MASWQEIEAREAAFAAAVRRRFDARRHKLLATLRHDGSPRLSGIEAEFRDGQVWLGMMAGSRKAADLRRDPRLALHSGTEDPPDETPPGLIVDAKLSGRAVEVAGPPDGEQGAAGESADYFRIDIDRVVLVEIGDPADHLLITIWTEGGGLVTVRR